MRTVAAAMKEAVFVGPSTTIQEASAAILDGRVEAAIVIDGAKVCGLVTPADVARALAEGRDAASTPVQTVTGRDPPLVDVDEPLAEVRQRMRALECPLVVVVGDDGRPAGVLPDHEAAP
jgi:predicted transcriptional regulator